MDGYPGLNWGSMQQILTNGIPFITFAPMFYDWWMKRALWASASTLFNHLFNLSFSFCILSFLSGSDYPIDNFLPTPPPNYEPTPPSPPIILENPSNVIVPENEPVTLVCHAGGSPTPMIRWHRLGGGIVETAAQNVGSGRIILPDGALFFLGVKDHIDAGTYWCEATNDHGTAISRNATLEIACKC